MAQANASVSRLIGEITREHELFLEFFGKYEERGPTAIADFVAGNPQEMPIAGFAETLMKWTKPTSKDHFAYKQSLPEARQAVRDALARGYDTRVELDDIFMTTGAFGALSVSIRSLCDEGDEVIYLSPPWFFYRGMIRINGAIPVRVSVDPTDWDIPIDKVAAAITPRTRAIIVNSPCNPSGRMYTRANLDALGDVLRKASARIGRPIFLISDEAYRRILFDGARYVAPAPSYAHTIVIYTYGKQLLTPGERIGYIALPATMPREERDALRNAITMTQVLLGWMWPNAVLQYSVAELERLTIDIPHLQRKRDRVVKGLRDAGYRLNVPEGTFYVLVDSPWPDANAFVERLATERILVLPGATFEMPKHFRISVTASDEMIERALPVFASAIKEPVPV
ncbi:MAG TPA: aminotransferase class I/II-fold pyridoxal phosphate-dependent enzyme [Candidatus Acidoferrales bacterium]|nr:aminotransferase class I/II-fold pyridoxal phosphate-dependent enzyme [Candidatus Acidoferrales bacterium]